MMNYRDKAEQCHKQASRTVRRRACTDDKVDSSRTDTVYMTVDTGYTCWQEDTDHSTADNEGSAADTDTEEDTGRTAGTEHRPAHKGY